MDGVAFLKDCSIFSVENRLHDKECTLGVTVQFYRPRPDIMLACIRVIVISAERRWEFEIFMK